MLTAAVVSSTIGRPWLAEAIQSVLAQTWPAVTFYAFAHGKEYWEATRLICEKFPNALAHGELVPVYLPHNTAPLAGAMQVYGAAPWLVKEDLILYLDDDNTMEPNHIETLAVMIAFHNLDWAYSLRKIMGEDGTILAEDDCEALGFWPCASAYATGKTQDWHSYCVDNSQFCVKREVAIKNCPGWYMKTTSDRFFLHWLKTNHPNYGCTGLSTAHYRIRPNQGHSPLSMFQGNNAYYQAIYPMGFPWRKPNIFKESHV